MSIRIITDNKYKPFKYSYEVPKRVLEDYEDESYGFILYRKRWYHLSNFMRIDENNPFHVLGYDGYLSDSFFSGVLIKLSRDGEAYKIATFIS